MRNATFLLPLPRICAAATTMALVLLASPSSVRDATAAQCDAGICVCNSPACTSCTVMAQTTTLTPGCVLDWSTRDVLVPSGADLRAAQGVCTVGSASCSATQECAVGQGPCVTGYTINGRTVTVRGTLEADASSVEIYSSANVIVENNGKITADEGSIYIETAGDFRLEGSAFLRADAAGDISVYPSGAISLTSNRDPAISALGGGSVVLDGGSIYVGPSVRITVNDSARDGGDGSVGLTATGPITIDGTIVATATGRNGSGGSIDIQSIGALMIPGTIRANGTGDGGYGGAINAEASGNNDIIVSGTLEANGSGNPDPDGDLGENGTINLGPACSITISGTLDTRGPAEEGTNAIIYRHALTVSPQGVVKAGATNDISCRNNAGACESAPVLQGGSQVVPSLGPVQLVSLGPCVGCGNSVPEAGEDCDDGNLLDGDACPGTCHFYRPGCNDGILNAGEECDDGNTTNGDGCDSNCTTTRCGNGIRAGGEECDDSNAVAGDGCDASCRLEQRFRVDGGPVDSARASGPAVAAGIGGRFGIVWVDARNCGDSTEVRAKTYSAGAYGAIPRQIGEGFQLGVCRSADPDLASNGDGDLLAVYRRPNGLRARLVGDGPVERPPFMLNAEASGGAPRVAGGASGYQISHTRPNDSGIHLDWIATIGSLHVIGRATFAGDLGIVQQGHRLAENLLVWRDGFVPSGVYATPFVSSSFQPAYRIDQSGSSLGGTLALAKPCCSTDPNGAVAVWADNRSGVAHIMGRVLGPAGTFQTAEVTIDQATTDQTTPVVAVADDGRILVAWVHSTGCGSELLVRYFSPALTPLSSTLNFGSILAGSRPSVAALPRLSGAPAAEFILTWGTPSQAAMLVMARKFTP